MDNNKLTKFKSYLKSEKLRQDKRVVIFLICLGISTGLWFLNALSKNYSTVISYPVKYINIPDGKLLANQPPKQFQLKVNAYGFTLLRHKLNLTFTPIIINVNKLSNELPSSGSGFVVTTSSLINNISSQISNELKIQEITPASFLIELDRLYKKQVVVQPRVKYNFEAQHNLASPIKVTPEFVTIEGPGIIIDTIDTVATEEMEFKNLSGSETESMDLIEPHNTTVRPKKVKVEIPVDEFTEKEILVPIKVSGKPDSISIKLFPSQSKVSFMVGLQQYAKTYTSDFKVVVQYNDILENKAKLDVKIEAAPEFIYDLKNSVEKVEYLIEQK